MRGRFAGQAAVWTTSRGEVVLLMPETFMNESGVSVAAARKALGLTPEEIAVVHDDLDLGVGRVRVRLKGSSGGHNGIRSIIAHLGTESFGRVRLGIGHPDDGDVLHHVLSPCLPQEREAVQEGIGRAMEAVEALVTEGYEAAMRVAHAPSTADPPPGP